MTHKLQIITSGDGFGSDRWSAIDANTYDIAGYDELGHPYSNDPVGYGATEHAAVLDLLAQIHDRFDGREYDRAIYFDFVEWLEKRFTAREVYSNATARAAKTLADDLYAATLAGATDEELRDYSKGA